MDNYCRRIFVCCKYDVDWMDVITSKYIEILCLKTPSAMTSSDITTVPVWQHHVAAIVIFLVWLELMMLVGRFPIFGLYVQMFTKGVLRRYALNDFFFKKMFCIPVAVNFAKFLLAYCCLLVAFGLSFGVIFSNYPAFQHVPW